MHELKVRVSVASGCWPDYLRSALRAAGRNEVRVQCGWGDPSGPRGPLLATDRPTMLRRFSLPKASGIRDLHAQS
jgi:hypothetical protein